MRSGRKPDPLSARSLERRGALVELPAEGYDGPVPAFGLPEPTDRELELWRELWRTPQATLWAAEPWRQWAVELYTRWSVRMEASDASAATGAVTLRLAADLALTPSGLIEQGLVVGPPTDHTGRPVSSSSRVGVGDRRQRPGLSVRERLRQAQEEDEDEPRPTSLERARRLHEQRDPRAVLRDEYGGGAG